MHSFRSRLVSSEVDWFDLGNSPAMFTPEAVGGKRLLMVTTNGTVALGKCAQLTSGPILAACLLNAKAVAEMLLAGGRGGSAPDEVWLVCAGSVGKEAAEDTLTAGLVALHLSEVHPGCAPDAETERAMGMVRDIRRNGESWTGVGRRMENARALSELGEHFMQDVEYCFGGVGPAVDGLEVVGVLDRQTGLVVRAGTSREAMPDRC
ncbi:2-phosphosulfolactate phosphatase-domain-containing protein [Hyaloraphidium curvatum]|nr:2-phosphosulfolactate phosphatase-domain-containing protein [Hyaloraphidium curvatum]